jgi:hypothetical protein
MARTLLSWDKSRLNDVDLGRMDSLLKNGVALSRLNSEG